MNYSLAPLQRTFPSTLMLVPRLVAGLPLLILGIRHLLYPEHFRAILTASGLPLVDLSVVVAPLAEVLAGVSLLSGFLAFFGGFLGMATMVPALYATIRFAFLSPDGLPAGLTEVPFVPSWPIPLAVLAASAAVFCEGAGAWSVDEFFTARRDAPANAPEVVIVGGGFGGLYAARQLGNVGVRITLIDRRNFHLFQPLLYQVATGGLSPANIAAPLRGILKRQRNARVLLAEVTDIDTANRDVVLSDGRVHYDYLIVAAGARHAYFGHPEWEALAPGLKTIEDATEIRRRVLWAFEMAERAVDQQRRECWMTFVVVGAGATGVEMAGAISELARHTLSQDFRSIDPTKTRVILVEGSDRILLAFHPSLSEKARRSLEEMGVEVRLNSIVTDIRPHQVTIKQPDGIKEIEASTVIWGAGVQASPLATALSRATGATLDSAGRIAVGPDLSLPGCPEVFAIGDMALVLGKDGKPVPGVAPAAMQQGRYVARLVEARLAGKSMQPFRYNDKGMLATIGRAKAVAETMGFRLSGGLAWLTWLFIHIMYLVEFDNRIMVLWQWFWNYITRNRSSRLITGTTANLNTFVEGEKEAKPSESDAGERCV